MKDNCNMVQTLFYKMHNKRKQVEYMQYIVKEIYKTKDQKERAEKIVEIIKKQMIRNK